MSAHRLPLIAATLAFGTLACSPNRADIDSFDPGDTGPPVETDDPDETDTDGDTDPSDDTASFQSVDGTLVLTGGVIDAVASTLRVGFWNADAALLCETDAALASAVAAPAPADVDVYGWWALTAQEGAVPCRWPAPTEVQLGLGPMDPRLAPALDAHGLGDRQSNLYALYLGPRQAEPAYVFGVGGTEAQFEGTAMPATSPPLPDGAYRFQTLHLLPLGE